MITSKADLIDAVATDAGGMSKTEATRIVNAVFDHLTAALHGGTEVRLHNFGTFSVTEREATTGRNPRTGEKIEIGAKRVVKFRASKALAGAVAE